MGCAPRSCLSQHKSGHLELSRWNRVTLDYDRCDSQNNFVWALNLRPSGRAATPQVVHSGSDVCLIHCPRVSVKSFHSLLAVADAPPGNRSSSTGTLANSARKRLFSICSALTTGLLLAPFSLLARCSLSQLPKVCSTPQDCELPLPGSGPTPLAEPPLA
jgi:hypothetical protein